MNRLNVKLVVMVSLAVLVALVAGIGYWSVSRSRLSEVERERLSRLEDRWVLELDIVNRDVVEHTYIIKVDTGDPGRKPLEVRVLAGSRFMYTAIIRPQEIMVKEVVLEVWRDSDPEPVQVSKYYVD
ncbi:MAG: hypothetical protein HY673_03915 [Chloroflexi bacterium]|nr:hypothetical protein [Chloroflexota bacterium]